MKKIEQIITQLTNKHTKLMAAQLSNGRSTISSADLLRMILHTSANHTSSAYIVPLDVRKQFPQLHKFTPVLASYKYFYTLVAAIIKLIMLLEKEGVAKCSNSVGLLPLDEDMILEAKYTRAQASKIQPVPIALLLMSLPDKAVDMLINEYMVRVNQDDSSVYNNPYGKQNHGRMSDHWNTTSNNQIDIDLDGNSNTAWLYALWDEGNKLYKHQKSYSMATVQRTAKEKADIISRLINDIYFDNPMAVAQLKSLKQTLVDDEF